MDFVEEAVIEANVSLATTPRDDGQLRCVLTSDYGQMTRDITLKDGVDYEPSAANLLYHFALVTQGVTDCEDFADWADEYGHDPNNAASTTLYEQYCKDAKELRVLLGGYTFGNLMGGLAIHQAINHARP